MPTRMDPLQKQMLDDVFDAFTMLSGGGFVSLMNVEGGFTRYSAGAVELFGLPGEYVQNGALNWNDFLHPEDRKRYMDTMTPLLRGEAKTYDIVYRVRTVTGEYMSFHAMGGVLRGKDGKPSLIGGALVNQGIADNTDPVTVLPNKNAYFDDLSNKLENGESTISLQIGITKFSQINEVHGYTYGNRTLQEVAWLLQEVVKDRGTIYRTDGATFILLSDTLTRDEAAAIYDHIRYQLQRGIQVNGIKNILTASGGLIFSYGNDVTVSTIYSCLNYAVEESKGHKHGELVDFNGSINHDGYKSLELINTIREHAANGCAGFHLEYIPVVSSKDGAIKGAEASIYWEGKPYGRVEPEAFMPILERDFIFEEVGDFILYQGLSDGMKILEKDPEFYLCLNVYRIQLDSNYFLENLGHYIKVTGFPTDRLSLKFDSDCRFIGLERLRNIITKLHEDKIITIIGDFGTGTDSIRFLSGEPINAVSIDGTFVSKIAEDEKARSMLGHLTQMAACYVEHINVKGVDTEELANATKGFAATTLQGRYFSDALPIEELKKKFY